MDCHSAFVCFGPSRPVTMLDSLGAVTGPDKWREWGRDPIRGIQLGAGSESTGQSDKSREDPNLCLTRARFWLGQHWPGLLITPGRAETDLNRGRVSDHNAFMEALVRQRQAYPSPPSITL